MDTSVALASSFQNAMAISASTPAGQSEQNILALTDEERLAIQEAGLRKYHAELWTYHVQLYLNTTYGSDYLAGVHNAGFR